MPQTNSYDALVVGAGPNGLPAGIAIAQTGPVEPAMKADMVLPLIGAADGAGLTE